MEHNAHLSHLAIIIIFKFLSIENTYKGKGSSKYLSDTCTVVLRKIFFKHIALQLLFPNSIHLYRICLYFNADEILIQQIKNYIKNSQVK
jgi:hypothetical protein